MRFGSGSRHDSCGDRPDPRAGLALALTFALVNACGGRTLENYGESGGEGAEGGLGGSTGAVGSGARPGSGARSGTGGGSGGGTSAGGTGIGAGPAVTGGGPTGGGTGGTTPNGGVSGIAGTGAVPGGASGAGGTGVGGRGGGSSVGGTAGKAGGAGRPGSGGRAAGGSAGVSGRGGSAGQAGAAGGGGSPSVDAACNQACSNLPAGCDDSSADCFSACPELAVGSPGCELELADYLNCVATFLDPQAMCMATPSGECHGAGCATKAIDSCAYSLRYYDECHAGCARAYSTTPDSCTMTRVCLTHQYASWCTQVSSGVWTCLCAIDGVDAAKAELYGEASSVCTEAGHYCDFVR